MPYGAPKMNSYVVETYCRPKYQYMHQYFHHFLIMLDPFTEEEFAAMYVTEYRMLPRRFWWDPLITLVTTRDWYNRLLPIWPGNWLTSFLPLLPLLPPNDCSKLAKVALMLKAAQELNKILHPFYHHSLQILYSRHWCSFILLIFHSQLLMHLTLLIPVLWRTHPWSSFQLYPILPTFMHRHQNWLSQGKLMWKILKKIGRNIPF